MGKFHTPLGNLTFITEETTNTSFLQGIFNEMSFSIQVSQPFNLEKIDSNFIQNKMNNFPQIRAKTERKPFAQRRSHIDTSCTSLIHLEKQLLGGYYSEGRPFGAQSLSHRWRHASRYPQYNECVCRDDREVLWSHARQQGYRQ